MFSVTLSIICVEQGMQSSHYQRCLSGDLSRPVFGRLGRGATTYLGEGIGRRSVTEVTARLCEI